MCSIPPPHQTNCSKQSSFFLRKKGLYPNSTESREGGGDIEGFFANENYRLSYRTNGPFSHGTNYFTRIETHYLLLLRLTKTEKNCITYALAIGPNLPLGSWQLLVFAFPLQYLTFFLLKDQWPLQKGIYWSVGCRRYVWGISRDGDRREGSYRIGIGWSRRMTPHSYCTVHTVRSEPEGWILQCVL